ncbi:hypothetical protein [Paenibacillus spongiae]|uniref:Uncharacterized protein n=1 Tax=Paenibacillus spongiae TaxID=2909671 RepID=A0ABY5S876_9BACL|nr:hypothetical protein [Paenibacillus spongiae]UVI29914.1 hypothetical protein L1F29_31780 [Paenibacillus spongiae]
MNKNWAKLIMTVALISTVIVAGSTWSSQADGEDASTPGSVQDPIVTKSYVEQQVAALVKAEMAKQGSGSGSSGDKEQVGGGAEYKVVSVPLGKKLIAKGSAEFVVRAGKPVAFVPDTNGIANLTEGTDLTNGMTVPINHQILVPRSGRGIMSAEGAKAGLVVMVRGPYELQAQE